MGVAQKIKITLIWENGTEREINPNHIKDLRITKKLNDHVKLSFCGGRIEVNEKEDFLSRTNRETRVKVTYTGENSGPALIFAGVATRIKLEFVPGENYYYLKLNGSSETYWLGLARRRRSFQNKETPYQKVLDQIAAGNGQAIISAGKELMEKNSKNSKKLGHFTLQYQETDWQFLKRLASRFQTGLVPDPIAMKPSLCVGLPEGKEYLIEEPLILGVLKKINRHLIIAANYDQTSIPEEYVYYKLRTAQFLDIGDTVTLPGIRPVLYVYLSTAYIRGSEFYFEAVVTPYGGLRQKPRYNRQLPGVTLEGYVIDVGGPDDDPLKDKVKVRINFDDPTPPEEAAWLPCATYYSAENHTGFYCLPEIGDYVKLRFSSTNEDKAVVVSSTRLERDREKLVDHLNTKMFRTNHQKELALTQTGVTLSGKEKNLLIRLDQDKGVIISSHNQLEIRSKGNLNLQAGRKVSISAKKAVDIKCGQKSRLVLNENETSGMIHIFGSKVSKEQGKAAWIKALITGFDKNHCYRHAEFESELAEFPEDYRQALMQLHSKHIEWRFEAVKTGKDWEKFITAQALVDKDGGSKSLTSPAYTNWHIPGGKSQQGGWYPVKKEVIAYFVDPRNFIGSEEDIFQFLKLDGYDDKSQTLEGVKKILENTKLLPFADAFIEAAKKANVNAYYLASKCNLESQGGTSSLFKGTVEDMTVTVGEEKITFENKGYYNAYNIKAFALKNDLTVLKLSQTKSINKNGAKFAKLKGWTDEKLAIIGGAQWCKNEYIGEGQDTMYANKFDYINNTPWHQYVQNIEAAYHEAVKYHTAYNHISKLDEKLVFKIPVYDNMPAEPAKLPKKK